jgi:hypothetical protein
VRGPRRAQGELTLAGIAQHRTHAGAPSCSPDHPPIAGEQTAIAVVNAEEGNPSACAVETVAFVRGASPAIVRNKDDAYAVVEILVVGVDLGNGLSSVAPSAYFMLVKIDERDA